MEDYPKLSGVYEVTLENTSPKKVYTTLKELTEIVESDCNNNSPFAPFSSYLSQVDDMNDLYPNLIENVVIHNNSDDETIVSFHWHSNSEQLETLSQCFAFQLQAALNPSGIVSSRTYTEHLDGSVHTYTGVLLSEDFLMTLETI